MATRRRLTREQILEEAHQILNAGRCGALTVDALARALRMSKSTLYKFFPSKEAVVIALVDEACATSLQAIGGATTPDTLVDAMADHAERLPTAAIVDVDHLPSQSRHLIGRVEEAVSTRATKVLSDRDDADLRAVAAVAASKAAMQYAASGATETSRGEAVRAAWAMLA